MQPSVKGFCEQLVRSRLLSLGDVQALYQRWRREAGAKADDLDRFTRWLVAGRHLTEYQAAALVHGRAEQLFLGPYKLLDRLGKGRLAVVYRAAHKSGRLVAIKVFPLAAARYPEALDDLRHEAIQAGRLSHPNVVRTFQAGEANEQFYLVMEHLDGETLAAVLDRRGRLPPAEAVHVIHQALLGLQHIHEQGLVHRNLEPANLMLVPAPGDAGTALQSAVKVLDVSMGRALFDGTAPGAPAYLAPEQARDAQAADIRADVYSAGCILYQAVAGQPPFPETTLLTLLLRHATEAPRPLREFNPAVSDDLQAVVDRLLARDPAQRYPTPGDAAQALQEFLTGGPRPPRREEAGPFTPSFPSWLEAGSAAGETTARAEVVDEAPDVELAWPPPEPGTAGAGSGWTDVFTDAPAGPEVEEDAAAVIASPARTSKSRLRLTRRDYLLLALGAATMLCAEGVGFFLAWMRRRLEQEDEPPPTDRAGHPER